MHELHEKRTAKPAVIPADKEELALATGAAKDAPVGLRLNLLITGTLKTPKESLTRNAPAMPTRIVAKQPGTVRQGAPDILQQQDSFRAGVNSKPCLHLALRGREK